MYASPGAVQDLALDRNDVRRPALPERVSELRDLGLAGVAPARVLELRQRLRAVAESGVRERQPEARVPGGSITLGRHLERPERLRPVAGLEGDDAAQQRSPRA